MTIRPVKVIRRDGQAALVEWQDDGPHRSLVPTDQVVERNGQAECDDPEIGIPYGLPWAEFIQLTVTPAAVERAFHEYGVWTADDVARNHVQALAALTSLYAADLGNLVRAARNHSRESFERRKP